MSTPECLGLAALRSGDATARRYAFEAIGADHSGVHAEFKPALARIRQQVGLALESRRRCA